MSGDAKTMSSAHAYEKAEKNGWTVVTPKANELFVDIDNEIDMVVFTANAELFNEHIWGIVKRDIKPSKSGVAGRYHVTLTLSVDVTHEQRLLYQLMLGSDRKRELLGYVRMNLGDDVPTLFFEKPSTSGEAEKGYAAVVAAISFAVVGIAGVIAAVVMAVGR